MTNLREATQAATSIAVAWSFSVGDNFKVKRICLNFDAAPTTPELITVTKNAKAGAAFDTIIRSVDPVGKTDVVFENIDGLILGDIILVSYPNTDLNAISGVATMEL